MAELLEISGLRVRYGRRAAPVHAVDGVDLVVRAGEVVALVGESGCGKTTLMRAVVGLERPVEGRIAYDGAEINGGSMRSVRQRVQMIFQDPAAAFNPRHTVGRAIVEGLMIHRIGGDRRAAALDALARVGLRPAERFIDRYPHELSGGQRQRALIAAALVLEPALLLADEPVASLDASIRGEILALLRSLVDEHGIAVLAVTHDLGLAWNIADRVAVMYLGRIVEEGPAEQVLTAPRHPYTQALLSVVPESSHTRPVLLAGETPDASAIPSGCRFHPRCPLVASGGTAELGIATRCLADDPGPVAGRDGVACHAVTVRAG